MTYQEFVDALKLYHTVHGPDYARMKRMYKNALLYYMEHRKNSTGIDRKMQAASLAAIGWLRAAAIADKKLIRSMFSPIVYGVKNQHYDSGAGRPISDEVKKRVADE